MMDADFIYSMAQNSFFYGVEQFNYCLFAFKNHRDEKSMECFS